MKDLSDIEEDVALLDGLLALIARRPVDAGDPDWLAKLQALGDPVDQAGVRAAAQSVLGALLAEYVDGDDATRVVIRGLFDRYTSFRWAVVLPFEPTVQGFLSRLTHFSARDQGPDTRDALLELNALCEQARDAGIDITLILVRVAEMSSDVDKYGMGSTREILLQRAR